MSMAPAPSPTATSLVSPIEATLRILQSSVPYLIGAAVVRQGSGACGTVAAELGRVPWLLDRRLTQLDLSDDDLPPNEPMVLDWPVPYQAEWVGVAPRLLVARLVAFEKTTGVLLGTLLTREPLQSRTREALQLSCQLIASSVATEALVRESEQQSRRLRIQSELQRALSSSLEARDLGRVLRDALAGVIEHDAFAVALFHPQREEVAYRYRAVGIDRVANELGRSPLDDGPGCEAARGAERVVSSRKIAIANEGESDREDSCQVSVVQFPLVVDGAPIGIVTLQTLRAEGFAADEIDTAQALGEISSPYFGHARRLGLRQARIADAPVPPLTDTAPAAPSPVPSREEEDGPRSPVDEPPPLPGSAKRETENIVRGLISACEALGQPHAFVVLGDRVSGVLSHHSHSQAAFMTKLDEAAGFSRGTFLVGVDDPSSALARACREARVVSVAWLHEILQPVVTWQEALALQRLAGGGRCTVLPMRVDGEMGGALVIGPSAEEIPGVTRERLAARLETAAQELASVWRPLVTETMRGMAPAATS